MLARLRPPWCQESTGADPFATLVIQQRLSRLAAQLRVVDDPGNRRFGAWHRAQAVQEAYERTLDEACALAGVEVEAGRGAAHRLLAEVALESAGWRW